MPHSNDLRRRLGSPELERSVTSMPVSAKPAKAKRHISFNNRVEQCVALEAPGSAYSDYDEDDDEDDYEEDSDEYSDEEDDADTHSRRSSSSSHEPPASIARLEPTQLKTPHEYMASPSTNMSGFMDSDDESYDDEDARYSVADPVPVTQDLALDQDGYDYYASDEEYDDSSTSYVQSVSSTAGNGPSPTHANHLTAKCLHDSRISHDTTDMNTHETDHASDPGASPDPTRGGPSQRSAAPGGAQNMIPPRSADSSSTSPQEPLVVDVENLPTLALEEGPASSAVSEEAQTEDRRTASVLGPTPQNTPDGPIPGYARSRYTPAPDGGARASGALVAPPSNFPPIPLSDDYVEENQGGLIAGAVEIINTACDLLGTLMGSSGQHSRSWYE